jgi:GTP-binding protein HflX
MTGYDRETQSSQIDEEATTCLVIHPDLPLPASSKGIGPVYIPSIEDKLDEACGLARAIYLNVIEAISVSISKPTPGYLFSKGHREDAGDLIHDLKPDVVIVNHVLSPVQQRNLEKAWDAKVIDRTGLILEIFGARAQTKEGKIQVELAALEYQRSRLIKSWSHLERQRGSTSFIGGPGETQLEIDRRLISERLSRLKKDLEQIRKNRDLQRRSREQVPFPVIALVGYTNAGKSTLFNRMTGAKVFAKDLLFATLDPTMRKVELPQGDEVILADTVGFIADLPTHLVASFRATLEQLQYADVILHVRDISRPDHMAQKQEVIKTLAGLDIDYNQDDRILEVWNKLDNLSEEEREDAMRQGKFAENVVVISALEDIGIDVLAQTIDVYLSRQKQIVNYDIPFHDGRAVAWLHEHAFVMEQESSDTSFSFQVEMSLADIGRFAQEFSYEDAALSDETKEKIYGRALYE